MVGYFGTEMQRRLQMRAETGTDFITATPGACQVGRMMGCDDPAKLGWGKIDSFLARDGAFGFRLIREDEIENVRSRLSERECRLDTWDVFVGDCMTATSACNAILSRPLPNALVQSVPPTEPEGEFISRLQALMGAAGVVPFSGSLLTGSCGPATTVAIEDGAGNIVAAAHGYMPHNTFSPFHRYAWGGLVTVSNTHRGIGLGSYINASMIVSVFCKLGATHIYELVSPTNIASRRMVEACGLRLDPTLVCGTATPIGNARYTR